MKFNPHYDLQGRHAPFSPSQPHWLNYSEEKLISVYKNKQAVELGTKLHEWAKDTIDLKRYQPRTHETLNMYINDAIKFGMHTEQILYYSERFFGTTDAILPPDEDKKGYLRIHDLKTGATPAHMEQLRIYAALFCLEYHFKPEEFPIELRLYQSNDVVVEHPEAVDISTIMEKIVRNDQVIMTIKDGEEL